MKKKILTIVSVCLILILAILPLMSCGEVEPTPTPEPGTTPTPGPGPVTPVLLAGEPQYGGVLKISVGVGALSLGYHATVRCDIDRVMSAPAIETLVRFDEEGNVVPYLATGWEVADDLKSITLTLRRGVKFHDGLDFNAEAAKASLDAFRASALLELNLVESVDVVDDYTIRLNLSKWSNLIMGILGDIAGMMISPAALEKGKDWCLWHPVGTGPFKFVSWERDVKLVYERFDDYWQEGKPYLDSIEFIMIDDPVTAEAAFMAGEVDMRWVREAKSAHDLEKSGKYVLSDVVGEILALAPDSAHPDSPFSDIRVRQAVSYAINPKAMCDALGYGYWEPTNQFSQKGWTYNPDVVGYPYNPEKARELLAEAGYPDGFKTVVYPLGLAPEARDSSVVMQAYLAEVGIDAKVDVLAIGAWFNLLTTGWNDGLFYLGMTGSMMPPANWAHQYIRLYSRESPYMPCVVRPDDLEEALAQSTLPVDQEGKEKALHEVSRLVVDKYCLVNWVFRTKMFFVRYPQVHDDGLFAFPVTYQWTPADAWMEKG